VAPTVGPVHRASPRQDFVSLRQTNVDAACFGNTPERTAAARHLAPFSPLIERRFRAASTCGMQNASTILTVLLWPVVSIVTAPREKQYWLYLAAAFVLAALVYVSRSRRPTIRGLSRYCLPWRNFVHPSAIADYKVWLINAPIFPCACARLRNLSSRILRGARRCAANRYRNRGASLAAEPIRNLARHDY